MNFVNSEQLSNPDWKIKILVFGVLTVVFSFGYYNLFRLSWLIWLVCGLIGAFAFLFSWTEVEDKPYRAPVFFSITVADLIGQPIIFAILGVAK